MQKIHPLMLMMLVVMTLIACKPGVYYSPATPETNNKQVWGSNPKNAGTVAATPETNNKPVKLWGSNPKNTAPVPATPFPVSE